jgi:hypothetical protein
VVNKFNQVRDFFVAVPVGDIVVRKAFLAHFGAQGQGTEEVYRLILTEAGYLEKAGRGVYRRTDKAGLEQLTYSKARREAYPDDPVGEDPEESPAVPA